MTTYEEFRRLRADLRAAAKPLNSMVLGAESAVKAKELEQEIERMRQSGELAEDISRMRLD